eukprot:CAMPEP_0206282146 /NCGR_PEP_ID=MMETSP0047_2-20121206/39531_1 /ASSEMBLY_ACC=CAM_ASM_000192 /TAXON_ID=195065 /ORGANISM="Chroomonas mesostigmatica_cf, Strain CCMP1168" /LENGTH=98 /DNA_ID=CAMNT_0053712405 /DNA_START=363 /DNA_END=656 /DNA_ORIENTATION=+
MSDAPLCAPTVALGVRFTLPERALRAPVPRGCAARVPEILACVRVCVCMVTWGCLALALLCIVMLRPWAWSENMRTQTGFIAQHYRLGNRNIYSRVQG